MPTSRDPEKAARQLANLRQNAAVTHGARSEELIRPLRERYFAELTEELPHAKPREVLLLANRLAKMELYEAFIDERGVIRHRRRGDVFPAAVESERLAVAFEKQYALLLERERQHDKPQSIIGSWQLPERSQPAPVDQTTARSCRDRRC